MRIRRYILLFVCLGILAPFPSRADGDDASVPAGYVWCALEHLSGKVLIPTGWFCRGITVQNGTGYWITREEVGSSGTNSRPGIPHRDAYWSYWDLDRVKSADYQTGFAIKVISGPFWDKSRLSKLAEGIWEDGKRTGSVSALLDSSRGTYTTRSFNREGVETVGNVVETQHFVELILLDTETPTMIFVTFDCPLSAWPQNRDYCERFFATLSLFQGAKQANHTPYPAPASVSTAADLPRYQP